VRPEIIKTLGDSEHRQNFSDMGHSNIFLDMSPEARETKAKISYWDYIKIKSFSQQKKSSTNKKATY